MNDLLLVALAVMAVALTAAEWKRTNPVSGNGLMVIVATAMCLSAMLCIGHTRFWFLHRITPGDAVLKATAVGLGSLALKLMGIAFAYMPVFCWRATRDFNRSVQWMVDFIERVDHLKALREIGRRSWTDFTIPTA